MNDIESEVHVLKMKISEAKELIDLPCPCSRSITSLEVVEFHRTQALAHCKKAREQLAACAQDQGFSTELTEDSLLEALRHSLCAWMLIEASKEQVIEVSTFKM